MSNVIPFLSHIALAFKNNCGFSASSFADVSSSFAFLFLEELGRACHFIQDMCTPVHTYYEDTFDAVTRLSQHQHFENYVDNLIKKSNFQIVTIDEMKKGMLLNNNLKTFAKYSAMLASEDFYYLDNNEQKDILSIAIDSVNNGIIATCAVLLHFNVEKIGD